MIHLVVFEIWVFRKGSTILEHPVLQQHYSKKKLDGKTYALEARGVAKNGGTRGWILW